MSIVYSLYYSLLVGRNGCFPDSPDYRFINIQFIRLFCTFSDIIWNPVRPTVIIYLISFSLLSNSLLSIDIRAYLRWVDLFLQL